MVPGPCRKVDEERAAERSKLSVARRELAMSTGCVLMYASARAANDPDSMRLSTRTGFASPEAALISSSFLSRPGKVGSLISSPKDLPLATPGDAARAARGCASCTPLRTKSSLYNMEFWTGATITVLDLLPFVRPAPSKSWMPNSWSEPCTVALALAPLPVFTVRATLESRDGNIEDRRIRAPSMGDSGAGCMSERSMSIGPAWMLSLTCCKAMSTARPRGVMLSKSAQTLRTAPSLTSASATASCAVSVYQQ
mmetsp:Transcript_74497/g.193644  ORF Transcript_74497/g.193644 Transcript_74497/m.193644 type:complete len:254 (+) Transcript_74497:574-1335(+)